MIGMFVSGGRPRSSDGVEAPAPRPATGSRLLGSRLIRARLLAGLLTLFGGWLSPTLAPIHAQDDPLTDEWEDDWIEPSAPEVETEDRSSPWAFDLREGLRFRGPDGVPRLHLGGRFELAGYLRDRRNRHDSEVRVQEGEIRLDGEALERSWLTIVADLDGRDTRDGLRRAVFATQVHPMLRISVGLQDAPIGIASGFDRDRSSFSGPAFASWLVERTDLGIRADGELLDGFLSYDVGYSAGEGVDLDGERLDDPRIAARLTLYPLTENIFTPPIESGLRPLHGFFLHAGFAAETSVHRALIVETPNRDRLFETSKIVAETGLWWTFGWGIDAGPVRLTHEWLEGSFEDVRVGAQKIDLRDQLTAMEATLAVRIHGPDFDSHPSRQRPLRHVPEWIDEERDASLLPRFDFPGEVELAIRYANGDLDRRLFELGLADFAVSSQEFRTFTAALSIRPAPNVRILTEVTRVIADQSPAAFDSHGRDTTATVRCIFEF